MADFQKVETESNWGYWDTLDGKPIKDGERVCVKWPDGSTETTTVHIDPVGFTYSDHGHTYEGPNDKAFVRVCLFGVETKVYLRGTEAKLMRI